MTTVHENIDGGIIRFLNIEVGYFDIYFVQFFNENIKTTFFSMEIQKKESISET